MAKFTANIPLKMRLPVVLEIDGAAGATHRIPDALFDKFQRDITPSIPGGVTWITQDETSNIPSLPLDQANVSGLTASLAGKFDKTGGTISGAVTASGGPVNIGGGTNAFDSDLYIGGNQRTNPTLQSQAIYTQHRVTGDAGAVVHDAAAFEIRLNAISNANFLNALEASVVVTGGANTIPDVRAITVNMGLSGTPTGTITHAKMLVAQTIPNTTSVAIANVYGFVAEVQTVGTSTNYSIYAPTGTTRLGVAQTDGNLTVGILGTGTRQIAISGASGQVRDIVFQSGTSGRWIIRCDNSAESGSQAGSDLVILARSDAGGANVTPLTITRSNGGIGIGNVPIGFFGTTPQSKKTVSGSRGGNAALASLITQLAAYGIITDGSSA